MRKWERYLVIGIAEVLIAVILFLWGLSDLGSMTRVLEETRNIDLLSFDFLMPLFLSVFLLGSGVTDLGVVYEFYKMEKEKGGE